MLFKDWRKLLTKNGQVLLLATAFVVVGVFIGVNLKTGLALPILNKGPLILSSTMSPKDLDKALSSKDFVFINVHTPYEGEIEKTDTFIPYDEMVANSAKLPGDKNAKIILYCKTGKMSEEAINTLTSMGYTNVRHLAGGTQAYQAAGFKLLDLTALPSQVLPKEGFRLPISWGDIGPRLVSLGVIDKKKFEGAVELTSDQKKILEEGGDIPITIDSSNSQFVVDMLWALGLAQKSKVYIDGPMGTQYKKDVGNFASTGGWTLARGEAVNYLNKFDLIPLTSDQQSKVEEIAKNVYRPCCGNSTWFPDCNHGMAALAAIELLVSKGVPEKDIYKYILDLNTFWFPQNYLTTATYFARQGTPWDKVDAKEVLGQAYSSAQGAATVTKKVGPLPFGGNTGGSCGA
jgi:rhodanese-related sulfurtransferase